MPEILHRQFELDEVAVHRDGDGRTLTIAAAPYDVEAVVDDGEGAYREMFRHGAWASAVNAPHRVTLQHRHKMDVLSTLGRAVSIREDSRFLVIEARVVRGAVGDHVLDLVGDDMLSGASVGFMPLKGGYTRTEGGVGRLALVERTRCALDEVSLTEAPAYADAGVLSVRESEEPPPPPAKANLDRLARAYADVIDMSRYRPR